MELRLQSRTDLFDGTHPEVRDPGQLSGLMRALDLLSRYYFRTEVTGLDNIPERSSLLVGQHIGGMYAPDMFMFFHAWYRRFGDDIPLYGLAHDVHFLNPLTREFLSRGGALRAKRQTALNVLARPKNCVIVYPAGVRELLRPVHKRGKVDFCGHKGFIRLALEAQVPIIPTCSVGADTFLCLNEGEWLAKMLRVDRLLRMPIWPFMLSIPWGITPGPVPHFPLPMQIRLSVGQPISLPYGPEAASDPRVVDTLYQEVQDTLQSQRSRLTRVQALRDPWLPALPTLRALRDQIGDLMHDLRSNPDTLPDQVQRRVDHAV